MFRQHNFWKRLRQVWRQALSSCCPLSTGLWPASGHFPFSQRDTACRGNVITWDYYLRHSTRLALLDLHCVEQLDSGLKVFWEWEKSQPLLERLRISHFEWTYLSYTVPDSPTFCLWLPRREIETSIYATPVPCFSAIEYERTKQEAITDWNCDESEIAQLLFEEEANLLASSRLWRPEDFAVFQFYRTLPYNAREQQRHGRWVQTDY